MAECDTLEIDGEIKRVIIRPGDAFLIKLKADASQEAVDRLKQQWKNSGLGQYPVAIMAGDVTVTVVSAETA